MSITKIQKVKSLKAAVKGVPSGKCANLQR